MIGLKFKDKFESYDDFRNEFVKLIKLELHGPSKFDSDEIKNLKINRSPSSLYTVGMLFPQKMNHANEILEDDQESIDENISLEDEDTNIDLSHTEEGSANTKSDNSTEENYENEEIKDDLNLSNQNKPSSMGITFNIKSNSEIIVDLYFAIYSILKKESEEKYQKFVRNETDFSKNIDLKTIFNFGKIDIPDTFCSLKYKVRKVSNDVCTVTIWLVNNAKEVLKNGRPEEKPFKNTIFQPEIRVKVNNNSIIPIETLENIGFDDDSRSDSLLYKDKKSYCRGHGCAGDWSLDENDACTEVFSNVFPNYEIKPIVHANSDQLKKEVNLSFLYNSQLDNNDEDKVKNQIIQNLHNMVENYRSWISNISTQSETIDQRLRETADRHINNCSDACERMEKGIIFLKENSMAFHAFRLANHAMLLQQLHGSLKSRELDGDETFLNLDINKSKDRKWRLFQLAFVLLNLRSIPVGDDFNKKERDIVDLIWFPTGGGKTEAYLGVAAFSIIISKLFDAHRSGTEVIMRYTLRLLTSQQFQRATYLIMALEYMRTNGFFKNSEIQNADNGFSAGLWVGRDFTPNKNDIAKTQLRDLVNGKSFSNNFVVLECPWCKTNLTSNNFQGYQQTKEFNYKCPEIRCDFGRKKLPICVIDEGLYANPPTLLLGTVDKFALLPWDNRPSVFFGSKDSLPPNLIIQDELHLISGPLGSVVGHYEVLMRFIMQEFGRLPKVIASTATIRRAAEQVNSLYRSAVSTFPPQGISYDDSFFAKEDKKSESGRKYIGVFASGAGSHIMAQVNLLSPIIQFPTGMYKSFLPEKNENETLDNRVLPEDIDTKFANPYGTVVWYFNSLRELGYADNLIQEDIDQFTKNLCLRYDIPYPLRKLDRTVVEMTSRSKESAIVSILSDLEKDWKPKRYHDSIDILLATSMISVGVDVDRLGLMVVNGQPKNTSEYIQASSRVGRKFPGLVFTLYNQTRSRDKSIFESFKAYHQSLYKFVEPTSVTPFSYRTRERSLAALLIGLAKVCCDFTKPEDILDENKLSLLKSKMEFYFEIIKDESPQDQEEISARAQVNEIVASWKRNVRRSQDLQVKLEWGEISKVGENSLLIPFGQVDGNDNNNFNAIPMMTSMRNVDVSSNTRVVSNIKIYEDN